MIRIASGQAFWGDWSQAPALQVRSGPIDYLILDYLAEVTIAILDKQRERDAEAGFARDFVRDIGDLLEELVARNIKVIASAGGVNPYGCAEALCQRAAECGLRGMKVGVVSGDDIRSSLFLGGGDGRVACQPLESSAPDFAAIAPQMSSAHVYLGAEPIAAALRGGAQIVVTGRCTDTALALGPMIHEFDVAADDWDALALGTVVGHILECGGQSTGGNYMADWRSVPDVERLGFPIAEVHSRERATVTKHESLGGIVDLASVKEQLLYEIGDPSAYITADCVVDFTTIQLRQEDTNRVEVTGVRGKPAPSTLKVSCIYDAGWKVTGQLTYCWPDAVEKARRGGEIVRRRTETKTGAVFDEWRVELVGVDSCHGPLTSVAAEPQEVTLRVSARSTSQEACEEVGREIIGLILTGPPGVTGYAGGRPRASRLRNIWSGLVPRACVQPNVEVISA